MRIDIDRVTCEQTELVSSRQLRRFLGNINMKKKKERRRKLGRNEKLRKEHKKGDGVRDAGA
jgi:predicted metal-dependent peptidase